MVHLALFAFALAASSTVAYDYVIGVGLDEVTGKPGIGFDPSRTVTKTGDVLVFKLLGGEHQVTQSSFASPCTPLEGGFTTGLQNVPNGTLEAGAPSFRLPVVNASEPLWFFDGALSNCITGSVLCVNTNETSPQNCNAFKAAAILQGGPLNAAYTSTAHFGYSTSSSSSSASPTSSPSSSASSNPSSSASAAIPTFSKASSASVVKAGIAGVLSFAGLALLL